MASTTCSEISFCSKTHAIAPPSPSAVQPSITLPSAMTIRPRLIHTPPPFCVGSCAVKTKAWQLEMRTPRKMTRSLSEETAPPPEAMQRRNSELVTLAAGAG
eukprot:3631626-Pleurochrysis_carterae.AAC.1